MTVVEQRYTMVYLLENCKNVEGYLYDNNKWIEHHTKLKVRKTNTANAKEFISLRNGLERLGISLITSSPHTSECNGLTGRINRTLFDKAPTLMFHVVVREEFWTVAITHTADLQNRTAAPQ